MIGYTPDLVTTVWIGYDDNVKLTENSVISKLIWADMMEGALDSSGSRWFREPGDVVSVPVDAQNGLPVDHESPRKVNLYFQQGNEPY